MLFSSLEFLFLYLPVALTIYFVLPHGWRNGALFALSLVFYGWGEPIYLFLMVFTVAIDYAFGLLVERWRGERRGKLALAAAVVINLGILAFFKYFDFIVINLKRLPFLSGIEPLGIEMPIGISFYTFQSLSYVVDVYRGDTAAQRSPVSFGTYVTLFPQLIAGPIVRYRDIDSQLSERGTSLVKAAAGARTFICGLCKKVLIANTAGELWELAVATPTDSLTLLGAWMGVFWYSVQIYFDFSGYSDMAIGLGRILGFEFPENFNYPYISESVTEFWRRWHISLSSWFREYVYIPLGGNRKGKGRTYLNLLVVWALTGLWHGADWNFIIWGLYYFVLLTLEKSFLGKYLGRMPKILRLGYTLIAVMLGWLIFASGTDGGGLSYLSAMFYPKAGLFGGEDIYRLLQNGILAAVAVIGSTPLPKKLFHRIYERRPVARYVAAAVVPGIFILCTAFLASSSYNPFLYWSF